VTQRLAEIVSSTAKDSRARENAWAFAVQPVGDEFNRMRIENFLFTECRHPIVALAIKTFVLRIGNDADEPFARAVTGEVRPSPRRCRACELMALGAAPRFQIP